MSIYDAKICFVWSQMLVTDEIKSVAKMTSLTFVEFLEAIARAATCMFRCSAAEQQGAPLLACIFTCLHGRSPVRINGSMHASKPSRSP